MRGSACCGQEISLYANHAIFDLLKGACGRCCEKRTRVILTGGNHLLFERIPLVGFHTSPN
jgi:hypothetical protein